MLVSLDIAIAKSKYTNWIKGVYPIFYDNFKDNNSNNEKNSNKSHMINIQQLRQPIIVEKHLKNKAFASAPSPIDIILSKNKKSIIISGPNSGGKTATLQSIGLCALMTNVGLGIPAKYPAIIPFYSSILTDIGDHQNIESSLSTFSGHLKKIQVLMDISDYDSLILLDELSKGTDPLEGAILGKLVKRI